ncbi:VanZ family protein [Flavobacteriaceae bacterium XHP0103]|uniref:VanZ family protein n=1 Tax=Marixanthotalea marina TaxID=2844359 RepID=UPI002989C27C|nr:VanZ family protein [Marixanthotalea marina]MBU3820923.1 VanZ family protein [Marixanthotalea marina]
MAMPAAIGYSIVLLVVCLRPLKLPNLGVSFGDKVLHTLAYVVLAFLWYAAFIYQSKFNSRKALLWACVFSIFFGMVIEVFQEVFTTTRQADVMDVVANTVGVLFSAFLIMLKNRITS